MTDKGFQLLIRLEAAYDRWRDETCNSPCLPLFGGDQTTVRALKRAGLAEQVGWYRYIVITPKGLAALRERRCPR